MTATEQSSVQAGTWRIAADVDWRAWDGDVVAYSDRSGDTHHFADFAGWMFARLAAAPADVAALTTAAADTVELRCGAPDEVIERTLVLFRKLDLLERVA